MSFPHLLRIAVAVFIICSSTAASALLSTPSAFCNTPTSAHQHQHQLRCFTNRRNINKRRGTNSALHDGNGAQVGSTSPPETIANEGTRRCSKVAARVNNADINANVRRRKFLLGLPIAIGGPLLNSQSSSSQSANAIDNPLNLKGTFWETGQLYEKPETPLPTEDDDFLSILENTIEALHSPTLVEAITEGKYGQASRLLRGGLISESKLRIAANALIDSMPEENDEAVYRSSEAFRVFLRYLDVLDAEVENASRPSFGGGKGGGIGGDFGDPRMKILTRLGEVEDSMKVVVKNIRSGL